MTTWIWQHTDWPRFEWREAEVAPALAQVHAALAEVRTRLGELSLDERAEVTTESLAQNLLRSSEIENEILDAASIRSSLIRRLEPHARLPDAAHENARSQALAALIDEATRPRAGEAALAEAQMLAWHAQLFAGTEAAAVDPGRWRRSVEPMQVVSGGPGRVVVHFEAPPSAELPAALAKFFGWWADASVRAGLDPLTRAALAHLYFVTLHPFEDGNGRMARVVSDAALAEWDAPLSRLLAIPAAIERKRRDYYRVLEQVQRGTLDVTPWLQFWLACVLDAHHDVLERLARVVRRARFWRQFGHLPLHPAQKKALDRMLGDTDKHYAHGIDANKYTRLCSVSKATATRHLTELAAAGLLVVEGKARATRYRLVS